jgi:hypothetical protein
MLDAVTFERSEAQVATQRRGDASSCDWRHAVELLGDEASNLVGGRRYSGGRADQCFDGLQSSKTGAWSQALGLLHVIVVALQHSLDRVAPMTACRDRAVLENYAKVPQRSPNLVAASLHPSRAATAWQMLIDEPTDLVIKVIQRISTSANPPREVCEATQVSLRCAERIAPLSEVTPIGLCRRRKRTRAQP